MKSLPAGKFKSQCLALLDKLDADGIVVTKHGTPVAKLIPLQTDTAQLIGSLKGKSKIKREILSARVKWAAEI